MDIEFECPYCRQPLVASAEHSGSRIECPACRRATQVPSLGADTGEASPRSISEIAPGPLSALQPIGPAWRVTLSGFGKLIGPFVLMSVIESIAASLPYLGEVAILLITGPLTAGWLLVCLRVVRGQRTGVADLFAGFGMFGRCLGAYVLIGIFVGLGTLALVVPGMVLAVGWSFSYLLIVDKNMGPWEAMGESWRMLTGYKWSMAGMMGMLSLINLLGALCFGVGLLVTMPMTGVATAIFYEKLNTGEVY